MKERYLAKPIKRDLGKKMVFLSGPRQVGKTTLAKRLLGHEKGYLNWDIPDDRAAILKREFPLSAYLVLDEIHKYRSWRNLLKGLYDKFEKNRKILVTGSARLDYYRYGGDSLQGRYYFYRLFPFSFAELRMKTTEELLDLLKLGGFPEPFFSGSEREARRWSRHYQTRLVEEEIRSLEHVQDLGNLELMALRLPSLVGSPLSINSVREDLQVAHRTVANWLDIFERLYLIFRLLPFGAPKIRAVKKEQKHYQYDWTLVPERSLAFENMVALHLLKWVYYLQDYEGKNVELRYFRDIDGREVDFVILENNKPREFIEVKWRDEAISRHLNYLKERFPEAGAKQLYAEGSREHQNEWGVELMPAVKYLGNLV